MKIACLDITHTNVNIRKLEKRNIGQNTYYTTTNNVTKTIDTHDKQKDLGVPFDYKLIFDEHISQVVNKATKMTKIIRRTSQRLYITAMAKSHTRKQRLF